MTDLMQQFEVRAILAERDREARAAIRASEAKSARRGLKAALSGGLARPGTRAKHETTRFSPSGGLRETSVNE
jgi:hypothetical protein